MYRGRDLDDVVAEEADRVDAINTGDGLAKPPPSRPYTCRPNCHCLHTP
jgi:hypothetical protein